MRSDLELIEAFTSRAMLRGVAMDDGEISLANGYFDEVVKIGLELLSHGYSSRPLIISLLDHESADVRISAAIFCLEFEHERSLSVLRKLIATQTKWRKVNATMTLKLWEEGALKLPSSW